jgi:hypothetical protein
MITRVVIEKKEPFAGGYEFGVTGAYEKLVGKVYGEVRPIHPRNKVIVNLSKAPTNARGMVEYSADLYILKPSDMQRGNGKLFHDVPNRGNKKILEFLNDGAESDDPSTLAHAGNGFLMRQGYTIIWLGWQGDLVPWENALTMRVPVATNSEKEIVGTVRREFFVGKEEVFSMPLSSRKKAVSYEAATTDKSKAVLTVREKCYAPRVRVKSSEWEFASCTQNPKTGAMEAHPSTTDLYVRSGFKPGYIYEFIYQAKNPLVLGLGFAGVRDLISFLRYELDDSAGNANPLAGSADKTGIVRAYAWGRSQSGRFLKDFIYQGFNEDESGRRVFDAVSSHVGGAGRLMLNFEFGHPTTSSQQHNDQLDPEIFPFTYPITRDAQTGRRDGILKRPKSDPYVIHTQTSSEYWNKRGALVHTDGKGKDIADHKKARVYLISCSQHNAPFGSRPKKGRCQQCSNPLPIGDALRALIVAMDKWVSDGTPPPASRVPRVSDGTLVPPDQKSTGFPNISGVRYTAVYNRQLFLDYGPNVHRGKIEVHPPRQVGNGAYVILVPKVDEDGNEIAGIRLPAIRVPLATYTGWNLYQSGFAEDELCGRLGMYLPFAKSKREREANGDPRRSLEERYRNHEDYIRRVCREVRAMIEERLLLPEDGERIIMEAMTCTAFLEGREESGSPESLIVDSALAES